ncbi:MAG: GMC family oxidoreductase N-terminal domain-containing protein, partial [Anaerolineales bacterium]
MILNKEYDYIVVGTGPGGATVAKEISKENSNLLILETGRRLKNTGFIKVAPKAFEENAKNPLRSDGNIYFSRARILGGSSYVAMGNAPTPPEKVFNEWGIDLSAELEWSRKELRVTQMPKEFMGEATKRINRAAASLGWEMKPTPKSVDFKKCKRCGLCMYGCPTGAKWTS